VRQRGAGCAPQQFDHKMGVINLLTQSGAKALSATWVQAMRIIFTIAFIAFPSIGQAKDCWIDVDYRGSWVLVEAFADPEVWSRGRYYIEAGFAASGGSSTSIQAGEFSQKGAGALAISRAQLYVGNPGRLSVHFVISNPDGRGCEDKISQ